MKFLFVITILVCLFLAGCGDGQSTGGGANNKDAELKTDTAETKQKIEEKMRYAREADYLIDKDSIGRGVFASEHMSETETFIGQLLIEIVENRGSVSEDKKQYFSDWAIEQLKQIKWELLEEGWTADSNTYSTIYALNYLYGDMGYDFFYSFDRTQGKSSSDKTQSVKVQAFIDSNGIIRSIDTEIVCEGEMNTYDVKEFGTSCLFYDDFQEIIIEEGIVYENKIVYEWEAQGLLSSGDAALSAEAIGEVIIDVLETGGSEAEVYKDLFDSESSFQMFQEQKWEQLGSDWKANCYYDCHYIYLHQKDGYVEFLYYIYPDYDAMDVETAKALTIKCLVNMNDGKLDDTELRIYSMTKEEYQAARKWQGRRIAIIEDGEIAEGGGNIPIPIPEDSEKKQKSDSGKLRYIYTNNDIGETSLCELLMEDLSTGNIENGRTSKFIADKETEWWSDVADEIRENLDAGWKMGEKYDFYCLSNNEQAENIHYRYYFYWNKPDEERERVLVADAWISEEGLEEMVIHWFISCKHFMNDVSRKREKETLKEEDIEAFLNFDWAAESVLMRDHTIEPECCSAN